LQRAHQRVARFGKRRVDTRDIQHVAIRFQLRAKTHLLWNEIAVRDARQILRVRGAGAV
jgi:hypothetical protein